MMRDEKIKSLLRKLRHRFMKVKIQIPHKPSLWSIGALHWWANSSFQSDRILHAIKTEKLDFKIREKLFLHTYSKDMSEKKLTHYVKVEVYEKQKETKSKTTRKTTRKTKDDPVSKKAPKIQQPA